MTRQEALHHLVDRGLVHPSRVVDGMVTLMMLGLAGIDSFSLRRCGCSPPTPLIPHHTLA